MGSFFVSCSGDSANMLIASIVASGKAMESSAIVKTQGESISQNAVGGVPEVPKEEVKVLKKEETKMETTLIILKPDCMEKGFAGEVMGRFCKEKFEIVGCKMMALSENLLREHYAHIATLPFFSEILVFMRSRPVIVIALRGEAVIAKIRNLLGPTDSTLAPKGTIRGDWGTDKMRNIAHASDSEDNAQKELKRFFTPEELFL